MCVVSTTCTAANNENIKVQASGFNSECFCNYGYVPSITNTAGTLTNVCTCPFTVIALPANIGGNLCCPLNSVIINGLCECNAAATPPYY